MSDLRPGDVFAGYIIETSLGPGRSGDVYMVRHPRLPRREVLEVLPSALTASPGFREQFERDVAGMSGQKVQDFGEHDGRLWVALEYVEPPRLPPHPASPASQPPSSPAVVPTASAPADGAAPKVRSWRFTALLWVDVVLVVAGWWLYGFGFINHNPTFMFDPVYWRYSFGPAGTVAAVAAVVLVVIALGAKNSRTAAAIAGSGVLAYAVFSWNEWRSWMGINFSLLTALLLIAGAATVALAAVPGTWQSVSGPGAPDGARRAVAGGPGAGAFGPVGAVAAPGGFEGLVLTAKHFPFAWVFRFAKPVIEVDGRAVPGVWGVNSIPLPPGEHRLHFHMPYLLPSRVGPVDVTVQVAPQRATELEYAAPAWVFSRGSLGPVPQPYAGLGLSIAMMVVPFVVLAPLILLLPAL